MKKVIRFCLVLGLLAIPVAYFNANSTEHNIQPRQSGFSSGVNELCCTNPFNTATLFTGSW